MKVDTPIKRTQQGLGQRALIAMCVVCSLLLAGSIVHADDAPVDAQQQAADAQQQLDAAEAQLQQLEAERTSTLREVETARRALQEAERQAAEARQQLMQANEVLQNLEEERTHAARQLADASISTNAQPMESDGNQYVVSGIIIEYAQDHPAHIPPEQLMEQKVLLLRTLEGFVAPRDGDVNSRINLIDIPLLSENRFYGSAIRKVCVALVQYFNSQNLIGVFVSPDPAQIDLRTGQDFRPAGQTTLKIIVRTAIVSQIRTIAHGDRIDPSQRVNNPAHDRIRRNTPLVPATPGDYGSGALLRRDQLEQYIHQLNRHPGRNVDVAVSAAEDDTPGGVALDMLVAENKPWYAYFQLSNTGTESTDDLRYRFGFVHNQLTNNDDIFSIDYVTAGFDEVHSVVASYEAPILDSQDWRWRVHGLWSEFTAYDLGFSNDNFKGEEFSVGGEVIYNVYQDDALFVDLVGGLTWRNIENNNTLIGESQDTNFLLARIGFEVENRTPTTSTFAAVSLRYNMAAIADTEVEKIDALGTLGSIFPEDEYFILSWSMTHSMYLEPLFDRAAWEDPTTPASSTLAHELFLAFRGQYTFEERVVAQEEIVLGGLYSVRGYEESDSAGDSGIVITTEYRYHVPRAFAIQETPGQLFGQPFKWAPQQVYGMPDWDLVLKAFLDVGVTMIPNGKQFAFEDDGALVGIGVGGELALKRNLTARLDWGFPLTDTRRTNTGSSRLHFVVTLLY
jgi:hemolysin activation/secretion protein/cell division protein FtsL